MYGWPALVHFCGDCSHNTTVSYSPAVWTEEHNCSNVSEVNEPYLDLTGQGADIAGATEGSMNHSQHDELANLFARNMQLAQQATSQHGQQGQQKFATEKISPVDAKIESPIHYISSPVHYISTHYTGTPHIRSDTTSEPSRSPPPPYHEAIREHEAMAETLRQHSIDPSALLPTQVELFANADYEQRLRLLELWRIAPPSYPLEVHMSRYLPPTSMENEEVEARQRHDVRIQQARTQPPKEEPMVDTTASEPISPIREAGEPAWPPAARMRVASIAANLAAARSEAEPYIAEGYHRDQPSQATDPVYAATGALWQAPSYAAAVQEERRAAQVLRQQQQQQQCAMEHQYGMYEQIRNHADWEALNERIAREKLSGMNRSVEDDDEMVL
ncbi:hypothetical protein D0859_09463 [Hortaea werneckii]|uniref:Uncharacterized protein n=1 Tax=Hortaea werneckii TaxID=91943 RepID=A0A3M7ILT3_HORWE|nr:hypothetical protein D0859_09463 [Hortaea werneckii]